MVKKTAKAGMKKQLVAQLRNAAKAKSKVDGFAMSDEELRAQASRPSTTSTPKGRPHKKLIFDDPENVPDAQMIGRDTRERANIQTFPCKDCGEETNHGNRSILADGRVIHIGCKKAPKPKPDEDRTPVLAGLPKHRGAKVPRPPKQPARTHGDVLPCSDYQGRTCLQLKRDVNTVTYVDIVSMNEHGLHLQYMPVDKFDFRYKPIEGYPVEKAVEKYIEWSAEHGATQDVLDCLARVVKPKQEATDMAKKKMAEKKGASGNGASAAKAGAKKAGAKRGGVGIGSLIRDLIMKGKQPDAIVDAVHKQFKDAKTTKANVSWYRNDMRKKGQKVPEAKG